MQAVYLSMIAACLLGQAPPAASTSEARLSRCLVTVIENVEVPALELGQLVAVEAREGLEVEAGTLLARIDDALVQSQLKTVRLEERSAAEQATNDINVRYSKAATRVAQAEYDQAIEANKRSAGTISQAEERRRLLAWRRAELEIEQSELDLLLAGLTHQTKSAEVETAQINLDRRRIVAPISGLVVSIVRHPGEWVNPGDPVLRLVRIDRLRIEGFLNATEYGPEEVNNRPVTIEVQLARGRVERFQGKVVFVSPLIEAGEMSVWAEVVNREEQGQWLLRPGLNAEMTVHLSGPAAPARAIGNQPMSSRMR